MYRYFKRVDTSLKFSGYDSLLPIRRIEDLLERSELDCFAGFVMNEARMKKYVFLDIPFYYVKDVIVVRADDDIIINDIDDVKATGDVVLLSSDIAQASFLKTLDMCWKNSRG